MIALDGSSLSIDEVVRVARSTEPVQLSDAGREAILACRQTLETILGSGEAVYGINTGFGIFAHQRIQDQDAARLSRNLILSHAVGTGPDLPEEVVRAAMLIRANTLAKGYSGVRVEVVQTLIDMLNQGVTPCVPSLGSMGSSGDLGPLSHMALVFTTDEADREEESGQALFQGREMSGKAAMRAAGLPRLVLGAKEGLAVNNGATFTAALAALAVSDGEYLLDGADAAVSLTLEALVGCSAAFDPRLHQTRGFPGQVCCAENIRAHIRGSTLVDSACRVQDAYSLRCAPQVHGSARDALTFVRSTVEREINAATDNPLLFPSGEAISGGNFHGEPVGMAMDFLSIALAEIASISERRCFRLTDGRLNGGLPPMLVDSIQDAGLNSGLMMPQYTAAALVLDNQVLATPDSVHSLPTSGAQEDHNANAMNAALHARQITANTAQVLAIEIYTAARAVDLRLREMPGARLGEGTQALYQQVRSVAPYQAGDAWWGPEIEQVRGLIDRRELLPGAAKIAG